MYARSHDAEGFALLVCGLCGGESLGVLHREQEKVGYARVEEYLDGRVTERHPDDGVQAVGREQRQAVADFQPFGTVGNVDDQNLVPFVDGYDRAGEGVAPQNADDSQLVEKSVLGQNERGELCEGMVWRKCDVADDSFLENAFVAVQVRHAGIALRLGAGLYGHPGHGTRLSAGIDDVAHRYAVEHDGYDDAVVNIVVGYGVAYPVLYLGGRRVGCQPCEYEGDDEPCELNG